jgi:hypothetical protein
MKKRSYVLAAIVTVCIGIGASVGVRKCAQVAHITIAVDPLLAMSTKRCIETAVHELSGQKPGVLCAKLQELFPCIESIACTYNATHTLSLSLVAHRPLLHINNTHIILANKAVVSACLYDAAAYEQCVAIQAPGFQISGEDTVPLMVQFAQQLTPELRNRFHYEWQGKFKVLLKDKTYPDQLLIVRADKPIAPDIVAGYDQIMGQEKECNKKHRNGIRIADARFENQIIFYAESRGAYG